MSKVENDKFFNKADVANKKLSNLYEQLLFLICKGIRSPYILVLRCSALSVTTQNTVISPNSLVWKFCGKAQFPHSFGRIAETVPFHKISIPGNQVKLRYFARAFRYTDNELDTQIIGHFCQTKILRSLYQEKYRLQLCAFWSQMFGCFQHRLNYFSSVVLQNQTACNYK